jgi:hypothetical protein
VEKKEIDRFVERAVAGYRLPHEHNRDFFLKKISFSFFLPWWNFEKEK